MCIARSSFATARRYRPHNRRGFVGGTLRITAEPWLVMKIRIIAT